MEVTNPFFLQKDFNMNMDHMAGAVEKGAEVVAITDADGTADWVDWSGSNGVLNPADLINGVWQRSLNMPRSHIGL